MSDEDPFSYTPLRVSKRKKRMAEGRQKKKMRKGEEVDIKEEIKEGIIEVFAGSKRRQLVDDAPAVCPLCRLPLHLLSSSTTMATPRVHMQDCKDTMADGESNLLLRDFCPDIKHCKSLEVVHYSKFNHSLEDWLRYQELEESYLASQVQQEDCFEADPQSDEVGMQSSEEGGETGEESGKVIEESRDTFEEGGETVGMSSSEEEGERDELPPKTGERKKNVTSPPSSSSHEKRPKPSFSPADERRELLVNKEAEQLMQVNKELEEVIREFDNGLKESNTEVEQTMQVNKELKEVNEDLMQMNSYSPSPVITEERVEQLVDEVDKGVSSCGQSNFIEVQRGGDGICLMEFSEHLGEGGDQEEFSHQVQGLIQGLEDISQQPLVVPSDMEDHEADFRLSNEMAQHLEKIELEHPGGLLTPDTSLNQSVPGEETELDQPSDQVPPPALQKPGVEGKDPKNAQFDKKIMLEKLLDDMRKRKMKETNSGEESATVRDQEESSKDEDDNNNKGSEPSKETTNKEQSVKADRGEPDLERVDANRGGEESDLERVNAGEVGESTLDNQSAGSSIKSTGTGIATGLTSQKEISSQLATAEKVTIVFKVQLQGCESIKKSITLKPRHWFSKAMEAVASRLDKEVSSLRFLVAEGPCEWRRLVGKEKASSLAGAIVIVKDAL